MRQGLALIVVAVVVASCGAGEPADTSTTADRTTTSTTVATTAPTTIVASTTSTSVVDSTTTTIPEVDVEFAAGEVSGPEVFEVGLGDEVDIWVLSDVDDEMHVHGYDLFYELRAGEPFHLTFPADVPGIFEVEVHTGHTNLFDIEVSG